MELVDNEDLHNPFGWSRVVINFQELPPRTAVDHGHTRKIVVGV